MHRIQVLARDGVLPGHDLRDPLGLDQAERGGEFAHAEVEPLHVVVRLSVVPERPGELEERVMAGDQHATLAGRDGLRRVERVDARVAVGAGAGAVPVRAVGVGAVLDQEDARGRGRRRRCARSRRRCGRRCARGWPRGAGARRLALEVLERHAEVVAVAVDELHLRARVDGRQRRGHERVGRAQHGLARARRANSSAASAAAGPARSATGRRPFQAAHAASNSARQLALGPLLGVDHPSHSSCRRARSRSSNPILNDENGARGAVPVS